MADINDLIARGITPPAPPNLIGNLQGAAQLAQTRANIGQIQAQTGLIGQEANEAGARTGVLQQQAQGQSIENALKYRQVQAYRTLQGLIQANTVKNPDGSTSTNMPAVLGQYAQQYPDYALDYRKRQMEVEQAQTNLGKSGLDLQTAQTQRAGLVMGLAGIGDPNQPIDPQKYATAVYAPGQREGWGANLPTPAEYAKNPSAYAARLSDMVNSSGSKTAVLQQQKAQLEATQQKRTLARQEYSALMANAGPGDYQAVYNKVGQDFPDVFPQLSLIPPNQVTAQNFPWMQQSARFMAMAPDKQQEAVTELYKAHNLAHLQGLQGVAQVAEANRANTEAGVQSQELQQKYGVTPSGQAVTPPGGGPQNAPVVNLPKGQIDLSKGDTPQSKAWLSSSPLVQNQARAILAGANVSATDPIGSQAWKLATKIAPNIKDQTAARQAWFEKSQPAITAINAATGHSEDLTKLVMQLNQRSPGFINRPVSAIRREFGDVVQAELDNVARNYTSEIGNAVKGDPYTQKEGDDAVQAFNDGKTWAQKLGIIKSNSQLLARRGTSMNNQFNNQLGGNILGGGIDVFQPKTKQILSQQGALKSASSQNIADYAKKKGIPVTKAEQEFKDAGYNVNP